MNVNYLGILVNRNHRLAPDDTPNDLVPVDVPFAYISDDKRNYMREPAASALEAMFNAASDDGLNLTAVSGYRSYERQKNIYEQNVALRGEAEANLYSAPPGASEHQTGLALDISTPSMASALTTEFENTPEGMWLRKNAPDYGFTLRYPSGKEHITGYAYEPWHFRYVGIPLAQYLKNHGITLEEYYEQLAL